MAQQQSAAVDIIRFRFHRVYQVCDTAVGLDTKVDTSTFLLRVSATTKNRVLVVSPRIRENR